jgi:uncharacterized OsmC-like protein
MINGVNLEEIGKFVDVIKANPEAAKVKFMADSEWLGGTKTEVTLTEFHVGGGNAARQDREFKILIDEPAGLGGQDEAPNPVELLASALAGCLTAAIATNAAMFGTELEKIKTHIDVNFDMHGIFGLDRSISNGAMNLHYTVTLKGKGTKEAMERSKLTIDKKSAIKNTLQLPLTITTDIVIEE